MIRISSYDAEYIIAQDFPIISTVMEIRQPSPHKGHEGYM